MYPKPSYLPSI